MNKYLIADFNDCQYCERNYGREPVIAVMPNGDLVCVMVTGGPTEPHNKNIVVISKSYDGGKSWTELKCLFSHKQRGVWATEIYTGFSNPMMVVYTYNGDCPYKELQTFVSYSYDNGETWSELRQIAPFANGFCLRKGIKMSNRKTLFPVYYTELFSRFDTFSKIGEPDFWKGIRHMCGVLITEDEGMTYTPHGNIKIDLEKYNKENQQESSEYNSSPHLWEPNCIEAEDGHIIMFMRNSHHCYIEVAESFDYGNNWVHIGSTDIPNADSKICLEKINEKVILVSNTTKSFEFMGRTNLQIQISDDYCKTWKHFSYVNNKEDLYFYPHIAIDKTKAVLYLAYENGIKHYINVYTFKELGLLGG